MAVKFLDKTGLGYFWSKIKAWCNSTFAAITHNQASNTINAMTGYSKPSSGSALTATDTLNSALGKLEAKVDAVTAPIIPDLSRTISGSGNAITDITVSGHAITATKGTTFLTSHQTLPTLSLTTSGSGNAITALSVSGHAITATKGSTFLTSHQDISGKVNKSGDTMTGGLTITNSNTLKLKHTGITRGTAPSASVYPFFVEFKDNVDKTIGGLYYTYNTDKVAKTYLMCYKGTTNENTWNSIGIGYDASGNVFTWAPTPATSDNSTKIATTEFVKAQGYLTSVSGTAGTSLLAWNTENTVYTVGGHAIKVKLPANPNSNWTSHLYAGASNGNANAATTNGNTYLIICDNTTARDRRLIKGTGATTVTSDANGVITIHSTDNNTVYTHPTTSGNKHIPSGGKSGQILRWSADGTATWGADNNTTYSAATQSANGLMSAADKKKLDGINATAGKYTLFATWNKPANGDKSITGCTVGKPVIIVHKPVGSGGWGWCWIKPISGCVNGHTGHHNAIGTSGDANDGVGGPSCFICIATATTVVVNINAAQDDDCLYVYR